MNVISLLTQSIFQNQMCDFIKVQSSWNKTDWKIQISKYMMKSISQSPCEVVAVKLSTQPGFVYLFKNDVILNEIKKERKLEELILYSEELFLNNLVRQRILELKNFGNITFEGHTYTKEGINLHQGLFYDPISQENKLFLHFSTPIGQNFNHNFVEFIELPLSTILSQSKSFNSSESLIFEVNEQQYSSKEDTYDPGLQKKSFLNPENSIVFHEKTLSNATSSDSTTNSSPYCNLTSQTQTYSNKQDEMEIKVVLNYLTLLQSFKMI